MLGVAEQIAESLKPDELRLLLVMQASSNAPQLAPQLVAHLAQLGLVDTLPNVGNRPRTPKLSDLGRLVAEIASKNLRSDTGGIANREFHR